MKWWDILKSLNNSFSSSNVDIFNLIISGDIFGATTTFTLQHQRIILTQINSILDKNYVNFVLEKNLDINEIRYSHSNQMLSQYNNINQINMFRILAYICQSLYE